MYDIFFINRSESNVDSFKILQTRFPNARCIDETNIETALKLASKKSLTKMFWIVWDDLILLDTFSFDYKVSRWDEDYIHVFKNANFYDGVCLIPKKKIISKNEAEYRFFTNKKEIDIVASVPKPFDIVFISYFEKSADEHFQNLLDRVGNTHSIFRINGIKGIHQAHRYAADIVTTDLFWVVDADAIIKDDFAFDYQIAKFDSNAKRTVYVWRSSNPINGLEYGYGGVKLLPRQLTLDMDMSNPDMTTSISASFKVMPEISNVTAFNTDAFSTWRSAFRECVKLASNIIDRHQYQENAERLNAWLTYYPDKPFAQSAVEGAYDGKEYGRKNAADPAALALINDFDWLKNRFEQTPPTSERFQQ
jgi:hypothetical protein